MRLVLVGSLFTAGAILTTALYFTHPQPRQEIALMEDVHTSGLATKTGAGIANGSENVVIIDMASALTADEFAAYKAGTLPYNAAWALMEGRYMARLMTLPKGANEYLDAK